MTDRLWKIIAAAACAILCGPTLSVTALQRGGRGGAPPQAGAPAAGQRAPAAPTTFPNTQKTPPAAELVARGNALYGMHCRLCHGVDLRGGEQGGVNLLRADTLLKDQDGELLGSVLQTGRKTPGMAAMPAIPLPADDVKALAAYFRSVLATASRQGGPPPGPPQSLNVLVGDAAAGEKYFASKCGSCHSVTGDLAGIGRRQANPMQLQNSWLNAGGSARTATVTLASGEKVSGRVNRIDDFDLTLTLENGATRDFTREGNTPKVEVFDHPHRRLLTEYTDKDIHDVTAYLVTLK